VPSTPPPSPWRAVLERVSRPWLTRLVQLPRFVVPALIAILLVAGLALPAPWGVLPLAIVTAFLGWLLALSWPTLATGPRLLRLLVVAILIGVVVTRATS